MPCAMTEHAQRQARDVETAIKQGCKTVSDNPEHKAYARAKMPGYIGVLHWLLPVQILPCKHRLMAQALLSWVASFITA